MGEVMFFRGVPGPRGRQLPPASLGRALLAGFDSVRTAWSVEPGAVALTVFASGAGVVARAIRMAAEGQTLGAVIESRSGRTLSSRALGIGLGEGLAMAAGMAGGARKHRVATAAGYRAEMRILDALTDVELADLEDPAFQDKLTRAMNAAHAHEQLTAAALDLLPMTGSLIAGIALLARRDRTLLALAVAGTIPQLLVLKQIPERHGFGLGREFREAGTMRSFLTSA